MSCVKYAPELEALAEELSSLGAGEGGGDGGGGGAGGDGEACVDEFQLVDVILSNEKSLLTREGERWRCDHSLGGAGLGWNSNPFTVVSRDF